MLPNEQSNLSGHHSVCISMLGWLFAYCHLQTPLPTPQKPHQIWLDIHLYQTFFSPDHALTTCPITINEITPDLAWYKFKLKIFSSYLPPTHAKWGNTRFDLIQIQTDHFSWNYPTPPNTLKTIPSTKSCGVTQLMSVLVFQKKFI